MFHDVRRNGKRVETRTKLVDYNDSKYVDSKHSRMDWSSAEEHPASEQLRLTKRLGYKQLRVLRSY